MRGYRISRTLLMTVLMLPLLTATAQPADECGARYFWVVRDRLHDPESIDELVERAAEAGANGLIVQVVGRGEAYYDSGILPPADYVEGFDPLAYIISTAKPRGMEVHAWVNAFLVWSAPWQPEDSAHVFRACPDWFMADASGRSTRDYSVEECETAGLVGATLSPAVPEVREFLASIVVEIAQGYDVEGIHLDYIRYPNPSFGYEPTALGAFYLDTGMDPLELFRRFQGMEELSASWDEWRRRQVTLTVETVRAALRNSAPGVLLSAAVMADPVEARSSYFQDWREWLREGLMDFVCTMAYSSNRSRALELAVLGTAEEPEKVIHGIGVFNQPLSSALPAAEEALDRGAGGICVFSLGTLPADSVWMLRNFWGETGSPRRVTDASVYHRVSIPGAAGL